MESREYTDANGRRWAVMVPDGCPDNMTRSGVPIGPPSLTRLGLPLEVEVRMHNQLLERGILTKRDFEARPRDVMAALQATYRVDLATLHTIYHEGG